MSAGAGVPRSSSSATSKRRAADESAAKPAAERKAAKAGAKVDGAPPARAPAHRAAGVRAKPDGARGAGRATAVAGVAAKAAKRRQKPVRDSFTMPREDFDQIAALKERAQQFGRPTRKSELLRAGLQALAALDDAQLGAVLDSLAVVKKGRPRKGA